MLLEAQEYCAACLRSIQLLHPGSDRPAVQDHQGRGVPVQPVGGVLFPGNPPPPSLVSDRHPAGHIILVPLLVFFMLKDKDRIVALGDRLPPARTSAAGAGLGRDRPADGQLRPRQVLGDPDRRRRHLRHLRLPGSPVFRAAGGADWAVGADPLYRRDRDHPAGGAAGLVPVRADLGFRLCPDRVRHHPGAGRQRAGPRAVPPRRSALHPVAIIVAILFFGGLWGFWGVFFAIPLATVVQAVLRALAAPRAALWPRYPAVRRRERRWRREPGRRRAVDNGASRHR